METRKKSREFIEVEQAIAPILTEEGYDIVDIVFQGGGTKQIAIFVWKETGLDIDSLGVLTRKIHPELENLPLIDDDFFLEVSSPGIYRKIKHADEFGIFINRKMNIVTSGGEKISGTLLAYTPGESIILSGDEQESTFAIADIKKASLDG